MPIQREKFEDTSTLEAKRAERRARGVDVRFLDSEGKKLT